MDAYKAVLRALHDADLMGLRSLGVPEDEYSPEAKEIAARLPEIRSYRDAERVLKEVFADNFAEQADGIAFAEAAREFYRRMARTKIIVPPVAEVVP